MIGSNYQMSLFDGQQDFINDKPIRLIELFGGYGSQALALKYLGVPFEHYRLSEWAIKSIQAYKDMHFADDNTDYSKGMSALEVKDWLYGRISTDYSTPMTGQQLLRLKEKQVRTIYNNMQATHNLGSITQIKAEDLAIVDTDKYCYIMTYSFPCQDLSLAGQGKGMTKDSGTRSGLLWEVERLLGEMTERPPILLMENVPQVVGSTGIKDFAQWIARLEELGYKNYWQLMNAKDYGIPQNRNRCFMVSILGDYYYSFPKPQKLTVRLKDFLDKKVDEKYYLSDKMVEMFIEHTRKQQEKGNGFKFEATDGDRVGKSVLTAAGSRPCENFIKEEIKCEQVGQVVGSGFTEMTGRIYSTDGLTPSIRTFAGGNTEVKIAEPIIYDDYNGRIRADQDCIGTLTTNCGNDALRNGVKIIEPIAYDEQNGYLRQDGCVGTLTTDGSSPKHNNRIVEPRIAAMRGRNPNNPSDRTVGSPTEQRLEIGSEETSNTLTTVQKDNLVVEPIVFDMYNKKQITNGVCGTITANGNTSSTHCGTFGVIDNKQPYRIRKLTEQECFRLMGVTQKDFERVAENQSTSSLYHLAGDSIVTAVLMAIFGELLGVDYKTKIAELVERLKDDTAHD